MSAAVWSRIILDGGVVQHVRIPVAVVEVSLADVMLGSA